MESENRYYACVDENGESKMKISAAFKRIARAAHMSKR